MTPEQMQGPTHRIDPTVRTDGFLAHFTIHSPHGTFEVPTRGLLDIRLQEIRALDELAKVDVTKVFVGGVTDAAIETGQAIGRAVTHPKETAQGIPAGVGRFFERTIRIGSTGVQKTKDRINESRSQGEAFGTDEAVVVAGNAAGLTADALGRSHERRKLAKDLLVDPYTTNPVLDVSLQRVADAAFAGALGVTVAKMMVPGGAIVSGTTRVSNWVWDTPPGDLMVEIEKKLLDMGAPKAQVNALLSHPAWTLTLQVALVAVLDELDGVGGRGAAFALALTAESDVQARFVVRSLRMLARHHRSLGELSRIETPRPMVAWAKDGELIVAAPVDYLSWTKRIAERAAAVEFAAPRRSLWLTGPASDRARAELESRGWKVHENMAGVAEPGV